MKKLLSGTYAICCYSAGFVSLLYWILSTGNLIPEIAIDGPPRMDTLPALLKNLGLVLLFGIQHTVMARKGFKAWLTKFVPDHLERSTYVLATAIVLSWLVWQWEPLGGTLWGFEKGHVLFWALYALHFLGWAILFISTFLINHFDLFGLRQAYLNIKGEPYKNVRFKVVSFYKFTRHPLYLGAILGIWATPYMTVTHLVYALLLTGYILVGVHYEENDLIDEFGTDYQNYKGATPKLIPLRFRSKSFQKLS